MICRSLLLMLLCLRSRAFVISTQSLSYVFKNTRRPFFSVNGELSDNSNSEETSDNNINNKTPRTGWTHSQPSESSDFWEEGPETYKQETYPPDDRTSELPNPTGWLHNTEPATAAAEAKQEKDTPATTSEARQRLELAMKQQERNHRIHSITFHACNTHSPIVVTEHVISLPLQRPQKQPRIDVYFTVVEYVKSQDQEWFTQLASSKSHSPQQRATEYVQHAALATADKLCLYLQGGPGFGAPAPIVNVALSSPDASWVAQALQEYNRIVLMDQRGTGRSTPITKQYLEHAFPDLFLLDDATVVSSSKATKTLQDYLQNTTAADPEKTQRVQQAVQDVTDYLTQFRADNIVQDAEEIRDALLMPLPFNDTAADTDTAIARPWGCCLGQSFGGFCLMTFLSYTLHPPRICLFTGGLAPLLTPIVDLYDSLWDRVKERSLKYYEMYPGDVPLVKKIVRQLLQEPALLPCGGRLTARRFLQLGLGLGGSPSSFAALHSLLSSAFLQIDDNSLEFNRAFLKQIEIQQTFDDHPFYFWLHESIYADASFNSPTNWAAHRAYEQKKTVRTEFDYTQTCSASDDRPVLFFGEMVFPWMVEDYAELSGIGLSAVAQALASKEDWKPLYDAKAMRAALNNGNNKSKAAAAVYLDDMYVDFEACRKVTAQDGPLEKCKLWVTNEYQHSGLRDDGAKIFAKLYGMATGSIQIPS